jgi:hypothetical protein
MSAPENEKPPVDLGALAAETFGTDYHGDQAPREPESKSEALTVEQAYERMQEARDDAEPPPARAEPSASMSDDYDDERSDEATDSSIKWTTDEAVMLSEYGNARKQLQADIQQYNAIIAKGVDGLAAGDKSKAAAIRLQLAEAEKELMHRFRTLEQVGSSIQQEVNKRAAVFASKALQSEDKKLRKAVPNIDKKALAQYLTAQGFPKEQIAAIRDHREVALAEKARLYDLQNSGKPAKQARIPTIKPKAPVAQFKDRQEREAVTRMNRGSGNIHDAVEMLNHMRRMKARA